MATEQGDAIAIIGALSDAGLLRTAPSATESRSTSEATRIIGALHDAGLLAVVTSGPAAPADPGWGPKVGDVVRAGDILQINKDRFENGTRAVTFLSRQAVGRFWSVRCEFPPND